MNFIITVGILLMLVFFFHQIWTFAETNTTSGPSAKLFVNMVPEIGSNEDGADLVHVGSNKIGADLPLVPVSVGADLSKLLSVKVP